MNCFNNFSHVSNCRMHGILDEKSPPTHQTLSTAKFNLQGYCSEEDYDNGGDSWDYKLDNIDAPLEEAEHVQKAMVVPVLAEQKLT